MAVFSYFPTHLALGRAFCNRKEEQKRLRLDIQHSNPALILSPRRYGKTSLAINTFNQLKYPFAHIDFYKELSEEDIQAAILNGIAHLISQFETTPKRLLKLAADFFSGLEVRVVLAKAGIKLELNKRRKKASDTIFESLEKLHECAKKKNKKGILYMDEFQVLGEVADNYLIEAAIREAAQKSTHIAYVFSGSNRHLIQQMFYDKKRPFYKLCDVIVLERMTETHYVPFIQKAAIEKWNKPLSDEVINTLFSLTEFHPYYVNKLCSLLWLKKHPTHAALLLSWKQYVLENKSLIEREIELLSLNQRKLLIYLAKHGPAKTFFSKTFTTQLNMSLSSISQSLAVLMEKDYLYQDKNAQHHVLDPLVKEVLSC